MHVLCVSVYGIRDLLYVFLGKKHETCILPVSDRVAVSSVSLNASSYLLFYLELTMQVLSQMFTKHISKVLVLIQEKMYVALFAHYTHT